MHVPSLMVTLVMTLTLAVPTYAGDFGPKKPSDILTVFHGSSGTAACDHAEFDTAVGADGNSAPFAIPPDMVFVVTEVEIYQSGSGLGGFIPFSISGASSHHGSVPTFTGSNFRYAISPLPLKGTICSGINPVVGHVVLHGFLTEDR